MSLNEEDRDQVRVHFAYTERAMGRLLDRIVGQIAENGSSSGFRRYARLNRLGPDDVDGDAKSWMIRFMLLRTQLAHDHGLSSHTTQSALMAHRWGASMTQIADAITDRIIEAVKRILADSPGDEEDDHLGIHPPESRNRATPTFTREQVDTIERVAHTELPETVAWCSWWDSQLGK